MRGQRCPHLYVLRLHALLGSYLFISWRACMRTHTLAHTHTHSLSFSLSLSLSLSQALSRSSSLFLSLSLSLFLSLTGVYTIVNRSNVGVGLTFDAGDKGEYYVSYVVPDGAADRRSLRFLRPPLPPWRA